MTNWEYLEALANNSPSELQAWFDSEHVETPNGTLHGDTAALEAKYDDDSREKLEADVRVFCDAYAEFPYAREAFNSLLKLLDRQAAITERELRDEREYGEPFWKYCETCETIAELTAQLEEHREGWNHAIDGWQDASKKLDEARRDRETYRSLLGQAIDFACAITLLVDEGAA